MTFLDSLATHEPNEILSISEYRKPKHMDKYLHRDSNHHTVAKYSIINTLYHWVKAVHSRSELIKTEKEYLQEVLTKCKYPS